MQFDEPLMAAPPPEPMPELKEYVVTLHRREDLDEFYDDMETPGGNLYIPDRAVGLANRRPISRNTHYMLSAEEAEQVRNDPRVLAVELLPEELGIMPRPSYTQSSATAWDKGSISSGDWNWGLLRCVEGQQRAGWGSNGTAAVSGDINVAEEGRNVDVIIVDGHINPDHPEYAVTQSGTGGSRVIQYNWFQHNSTVWPANTSSTYVYTPYDNGATQLTDDNNHGAHVAGTACGSLQGWAKSANIYNISPYSTNPNSFNTLYLFDYIRAFHNSKGNGNPTICNHSWGYGYEYPISGISSVVFRGVTYTGPFTQAQLLGFGIINNGLNWFAPARYPALDADVVDAIADGIITVAAASNDYAKVDVVGGTDYNNRLIYSGSTVYYHRGSSPGAADDVICVGAVSTLVNETKATFSNCGPRVDIYAPGQGIMSSVNSSTSYASVADPRNGSYFLSKIQGTSMASPQVCGVLAAALEIYPRMTQAQARDYIINSSKLNQMTDTGGDVTDYTSLQGSENRYLFKKPERRTSGTAFPNKTYFVRSSSGMTYPRTRIRRT